MFSQQIDYLRANLPGLDLQKAGGGGMCLFANAAGTALRSTEPPVQWVVGILSSRVK
jgi:hypothetical protein